MPTYEYKCKKCGDLFDVFQNMTDDPIKTCPSCGGEVERLISAGDGLIFKGSGFYITDYRSDSYQKAERAEKTKSSSVSSSSSKSSGKTTKVAETK